MTTRWFSLRHRLLGLLLGGLAIGWLTYVRKAGLAEVLPPGTKVESFGEPPGTLITLNGERFEPDSPEQRVQALAVAKPSLVIAVARLDDLTRCQAGHECRAISQGPATPKDGAGPPVWCV